LICTRCNDRAAWGIGQGANRAHAEPDRKATVAGGRLQRSFPTRGCNAHRPHVDTVFDGVRDNLRRGVEAHWLAVEQRRTDVRMPALEPGTGVGDQRKRRSMTFRKAMRFELELPEGLFDEFPLVPVGHAVDQLGSSRAASRSTSPARRCRDRRRHVGLPITEEVDRPDLASPRCEQGHDVAPQEAGGRDSMQQRDRVTLARLRESDPLSLDQQRIRDFQVALHGLAPFDSRKRRN
jgi:hypothetical protein